MPVAVKELKPAPDTVMVWCEAMNRRELRLAEGDVARAISSVQGQPVKAITLHPKNAMFASEVPDGIPVNYSGGCLAFEIWLSVDEMPNSTTSKPQNTPIYAIEQGADRAAPDDVRKSTPPVPKTIALPTKTVKTAPRKAKKELGQTIMSQNKPLPRVKKAKLGHNSHAVSVKQLPLALIFELAGQGQSSRDIAGELGHRGIKTSYKTVQRILGSGSKQAKRARAK